MSIPERTYSAPSLPSVQRKSEIIDREGLDEITCDLDYSPQRELPARSGRIVAIAVLQATIVGTIAGWILGGYVLPLVVAFVPLPVVGFIILLTVGVVAVDSAGSLEDNLIRLLKNLWLAIWLTAAIFSVPFLMRPTIAALWFGVVALPLAVFFAFRFTTFGVHWITGHPLGDGDVMLQSRDIWQHRYERTTNSVPDALSQSPNDREQWQSLLRAIRSHDYGSLWCFIATATALTVTWCSRESFPESAVGLHAVVSVLFGLFVAAIVRCGGSLPLRLVKQMLLRWFMYDWDAQATPWMFRSPCGDMRFRRQWFWAVLAVVAIAVNHLAGAYTVISVPASQSLAVIWPQWTQPVLLTLITGVCCVAIPVIALTMIVCIVAGPALTAFDNLYSE